MQNSIHLEDGEMKKQWMALLLIGLIMLSLACSFSKKENNQKTQNQPAQQSEPAQAQTGSGAIQENTSNNGDLVELRQWASGAQASSEYGSENWSAEQATGRPDTQQCGDEVTAWASAASDGVDWLELTFDMAVRPTQINIFQSYNPSQVTEVIVYDLQGASYPIYKANPKIMDDCPYTLSIPIKEAKYETQRIRIKIDQSQLGISWNEIDAVELVGFADPGAASASQAQQSEPVSSKPSSTSISDAPRFFYDELDGPLSDLWIDEVYYYTDEDDPDAEPQYTIKQERGRLKFFLDSPWQYVYYIYTPHTYRDVRIDYEIENKGVNTNNVGLVCRYTDYGYYEFIATSGGYYSIMRYYEDGNKELATGGIKSIRFGTEKKNVFTAICKDNYLYFLVNNVEIAKVYDDEISDGLAGINVSAEDVIPVQVEVNWIEISEP